MKLKRLLASFIIIQMIIAFNVAAVFALSSDQYESNNTITTATTISSGTISANLHNTTDIDWYSFSTTTAYRAVSITLTPTVTPLPDTELLVSLYTSSGTLLRNCYITATKKRSLTYAFENTGTYRIRVATNTNTTGRAYTLTLSVNAPSVEQYIEVKGQDDTQWCWAACAEMTGERIHRFRNNFINPRDVTQSQIVQAVHGNTQNLPSANIGENAQALNWVVDTNINSGTSSGQEETYTVNQLFQKIWSRSETIDFRVGNGDANGHACIISGVSFDLQNNLPVNPTVNVVDPWSGGDTFSIDYNALFTTGYRTGDTRTWTHSVRIN